MRAGDTVEHGPSGETWVVACTKPATDRLIAAGWPESVVEMSDCKIVATCSDEKHREMLEACAKHNGLRGSWARQQLADLNQRETLKTGNNRAERKEGVSDDRPIRIVRLPRPEPGCTVSFDEQGLKLELKAIADDKGETEKLELTDKRSHTTMVRTVDPDMKRVTLQFAIEIVIVEIE